jgi:O-antigen ligase
MENEYARILAEQGVLGLLLWVGFIIWFLSRYRSIFSAGPWATSRRLIFGLSIFGLLTGMIGTGMLTAIPQTAVFILGIGFLATPMKSEAAETRSLKMAPALAPQRLRPVASLRSDI